MIMTNEWVLCLGWVMAGNSCDWRANMSEVCIVNMIDDDDVGGDWWRRGKAIEQVGEKKKNKKKSFCFQFRLP